MMINGSAILTLTAAMVAMGSAARPLREQIARIDILSDMEDSTVRRMAAEDFGDRQVFMRSLPADDYTRSQPRDLGSMQKVSPDQVKGDGRRGPTRPTTQQANSPQRIRDQRQVLEQGLREAVDARQTANADRILTRRILTPDSGSVYIEEAVAGVPWKVKAGSEAEFDGGFYEGVQMKAENAAEEMPLPMQSAKVPMVASPCCHKEVKPACATPTTTAIIVPSTAVATATATATAVVPADNEYVEDEDMIIEDDDEDMPTATSTTKTSSGVASHGIGLETVATLAACLAAVLFI